MPVNIIDDYTNIYLGEQLPDETGELWRREVMKEKCGSDNIESHLAEFSRKNIHDDKAYLIAMTFGGGRHNIRVGIDPDDG